MAIDGAHRQDIRDLAYRYAQAVDRRNFDALGQLFMPEGLLLGPQFEMAGREAIVKNMQSLARFKSTLHCVHNQLVDLHGDDAEAETYCIANHIIDTDGVLQKMDWGIRYLDQLKRHEGEWKIARRELVLEWSQTLPLNLPA